MLVTDGRVTGVETGRRTITAAAVVDAAGGWVRPVGALAGARVPVATVRHQLLITSPDSGVDPADPIARVVDAAVYLRPARGGLMVGGFEPDPLPLEVERGRPPRSAPTTCRWTWACCGSWRARSPWRPRRRVPAPVAEHRGGLFTMSPDGRFTVGPVPDRPGLWVASGCNGSGFSSSLAIGEALASWISGRRRADGDGGAGAGEVRSAGGRRAGQSRDLAVRALLRPWSRSHRLLGCWGLKKPLLSV